MNDIILNKIQTIDRCLKRIREDYEGNPENLSNYTKQDAIVLNLQRACEACIDLAMHIVSVKKLGIPQSSRDAFDLLLQNDLIDPDLCSRMKAMVGFRNVAVHDYQALNLGILQAVLELHLNDFTAFAGSIRNIPTA